MNVLTLLGRIGKDPETTTVNGTTITKFSLATNDGTKDKPKTNWHNIVAFGKTAEVLAKYVSKGDMLCVTGRVDYNEYEKDGVKRYATNIVVDKFSFAGKNNKSDSPKPKAHQEFDDDMPSGDDYNDHLPF